MELKTFFAQDAQGNTLPTPTAYLYLPGTTTLASGLQDASGSPLSNPFTGDANGRIQLAAPDGDYDLRVVKAKRDYTMRVRFIDVAEQLADVQGIVDDLKTVWYGDLPADPEVDPLGNPPKAGASYYNTTLKQTRIFDGAEWGAQIDPTDASAVAFQQAGSDAVARTAQDKLREFVSVKDFGAVCDGVADDTAAIQNAFDYADSIGGAIVCIPSDTAISDALYIGSNTTVIQSGTIKLLAATSVGGMVLAKPGAVNSVIYGMNLDGNNIPGQNGLGVGGSGGSGFKFIGGSARNFKHSKTIKGGRALSAQLGTLANPVSDIVFHGFSISNCYQAIDFHGRTDQPARNILFSDITVDNCEILFAGFGQGAGLPYDGSLASVCISNVIAKNVGKNLTYDGRGADTNGVFSFDRACNITITNVQIFNESSYGKVGGLFKGKCYFVKTSNIQFDGDAVAAVNGERWAEGDSIGPDSYAVSDCEFNFNCHGAIDVIVKPEVGGSGKMSNVIVSGTTNTVTSDTPYDAEMSGKSNCFLDIYNKATRTNFKSRFDFIRPTTITFTALTDGSYDYRGAVMYNLSGLRIGGGSTGGGIGNGTSVYGMNLSTGGFGNLFLYGPAGTNVAYTETDGFHVNGSAWNGRHFVMGNYHLWVDTTGNLRIKNGSPTSDTDGTVVGAQS